MEWHQIQYFQMVAKTQHITRAAEQLSISQPALSRSIAKLEEELGVQLFDRKGRNIYLNRYGEMFLNRVEQSIKQIEIGKQEIRDEIHPDHGTISLAFLPSLGMSIVPEIVSSYQNQYFNVKFHLTQDSTKQVMEQLKSGNVDLALIALLHDDKDIVWEPLLTEELFLIVSVDHWLASYDEVDLKMIAKEPFISFKDGYGLRTIIHHLCNEAGFSPNIVFEGEEIGTVSGFVGAKLGVSLVPDLQVLDKNKVKLIHLKHPRCKRDVGVAWLKDSYLSPVTKRFIQYVKHLF
ncbi:LysR family transcriptional regulator [Heyndrickxia ginsengihumi]|uniref:LysR family transcriptional regulator n=1 Tax=Heyndrickxia ginsengihumi TaxID=363870 RepID=A0A0A6Y2S9_9BACI|nr:LysR family transcriptional regulator [Heyndrickxia ginsengihumi]KHD86597.1 LysR family transcriptional regulator [Heyndrickxia ginsengihumi]MBE6183083.1 LysR family transcriptional regulator [Bacillus sp. (in: firmicutes)]MCM3022632.1 LysR family transcriptional regulator [Heyndrickxia ginsengihumi]NEY19033.1 LysR family transcriptional regulator [Heyndrickxia ginsengihumi]